jgi:hypothetical protein
MISIISVAAMIEYGVLDSLEESMIPRRQFLKMSLAAVAVPHAAGSELALSPTVLEPTARPRSTAPDMTSGSLAVSARQL